jgi:hypothetical protein
MFADAAYISLSQRLGKRYSSGDLGFGETMSRNVRLKPRGPCLGVGGEVHCAMTINGERNMDTAWS